MMSRSFRSQCASHQDSPNVAVHIGDKVNDPPNEKKSSIFGQDISHEVSRKYSHLFEQDTKGSFQKPYKMTLIDGYEPVIDPVRFVPYAKMKDFRRELDRIQALGVISPAEVPTEFVNSVVMTTKSNGEVRVCLDPKGLNKALVQEHHHIKTREEICAALAGAKFFTQLDLHSAFWQIPLDQESRKLTTFGTPFGRYHYNVLLFGIKPASEICQKRVEDEIVCDAPILMHTRIS